MYLIPNSGQIIGEAMKYTVPRANNSLERGGAVPPCKAGAMRVKLIQWTGFLIRFSPALPSCNWIRCRGEKNSGDLYPFTKFGNSINHSAGSKHSLSASGHCSKILTRSIQFQSRGFQSYWQVNRDMFWFFFGYQIGQYGPLT